MGPFSDSTIWGLIILVWVTLMTIAILQYTDSTTTNHIRFENQPQLITPNTTPPWEA